MSEQGSWNGGGTGPHGGSMNESTLSAWPTPEPGLTAPGWARLAFSNPDHRYWWSILQARLSPDSLQPGHGRLPGRLLCDALAVLMHGAGHTAALLQVRHVIVNYWHIFLHRLFSVQVVNEFFQSASEGHRVVRSICSNA
jgi:hypothetical protein